MTLVAVFYALSSCSDGSSTPAEGTIALISVTPSTGLTDDTATSFQVAVSYTLNTGQGVLGIGFNNGSSINSYIMVTSAAKIVDSGSGSHTFNVTATTKDWTTSGDFKVYVNISEYPHDTTWKPLASDRQTLTF